MKLTKQEQKWHDLAHELIYSIEPGKHRVTLIKCPVCGGHEDTDCCSSFGDIEASEFIFRHWLPGAEHSIGKAGIFFTPPEFALSVAWAHSGGGRVLEPTAGIGVIAHKLVEFHSHKPRGWVQLVCVEQQPKFVEIGKRLLPEAEWHCGDIRDLLPRLGPFESAIGNPPFGRVPTMDGDAHYFICSLMTKATRCGGVFLLPASAHDQQSTRPNKPDAKYQAWASRHEGWRITETAFIGPSEFSRAQLKTAICELTNGL